MTDTSPNGRVDRTTGRRSLLAGVGAVGASLLAGCSGLGGGPSGDSSTTAGDGGSTGGSDGSGGSQGGSGSGDGGTSETTTKVTPDPDAEAHVVGVNGLENDGRSYTFPVIIEVSEGGRSTRVDYWTIETLGGEQLGKFQVKKDVDGPRFQTTGTVDLPDGVSSVVLRAHHVKNGFGGSALLVKLGDDVKFDLVQQGAEKQSFSDYTFESED
jgi:hypothetical protein